MAAMAVVTLGAAAMAEAVVAVVAGTEDQQ